jgi:glyoxylase-like metal-dependent hydrolase (beta-lactamase superfamily II)
MYDWLELGDGVFSRRYRSLELNVGAVVCGEGILLIDTRAHHGQADELLRDLRRVSPHPVRWVLNTHHHWDHTFGNAVFLPAAIWGHERCAEVLAAHGERMREEVKAWAPDLAEVFDEVEITPPEHTFRESVTLRLDGRTVEFRYLGRGHTDNDVVVLVPDSDVVFAGDLIEESAPPAFQDSFPLEWPEAVTALLELVAGPVVPGHGRVVEREFVAAQQQDLAAVAGLAVERHAAGMSAAEAASAGGPFGPEPLLDAFTRAWPGLDVAG